MFEAKIKVRLYDTDAAGVVFFANYFKLAHDAYEEFMDSIGCGIDRILKETAYILPVVHGEADYKKPLTLGETVTVSITAQVKETSFVLYYTLKDVQGGTAAILETVHVAVDGKTKKKIPLPENVRQGLLTIA